jgi:Peptidase family M28
VDLRRFLFLVAVVINFVAPAGAASIDVAELTDGISAEGIRRHVVVLGSDALEGRAPGSKGGDQAAAYIASELEALGLEPLGDDGGFFQQVPLQGSRPRPRSRLLLTSLGEHRNLEFGDDYLLITTGEQTLLPRPTPMVFVGYGIVAPEFDYDDYADVDVRGKVVVFVDGEPSSRDPDYFAGDERSVYSAVETKSRIALSRGAVASVLLLGETASSAEWARRRRMYAFEHITPAEAVPRHLSLILHPALAPQLFADSLFDYPELVEMKERHSMRSFHLPVQLAFVGDFDTRSFLAPNVIGLIRGSDPRLRDTFVVISAHYDHLGIGPQIDGDGIYNGVVDNALGVAGALEIARVVAGLERPSRRSLLFVFPTAEEEGNLGSSYFLEHAPAPLPDLVADINIDGLAFLELFDDMVGIGGELSDLGELLERSVKPLGLEVTMADDVMWGHEAFARSDQSAFAEAGVPSILVNEGFVWHSTSVAEAAHRMWLWFETRYHTPADDLHQPLDFDVARRHCRAILSLVWVVADSSRAPEWRAGSPYAYERLLSKAEHER